MTQKDSLPSHQVQAGQEIPSAPGANPAEASKEARSSKRITVTSWDGPLPPPQALGGYNNHVKDGAERVFRQFELEAEHRRWMQRMQLRELLAGKLFALLFVIGMIGLSGYAVSLGYPTLAGILGTSVLGSVVGAFIYTGGTPDLNPRVPDPRQKQKRAPKITDPGLD